MGIETDMHTRRIPYKDKGRDRGDASKSQEAPKLPANHQKGRQRPEQLSEETNPADTLIFNFWPPDCEAINFCCLSLSVCSTLLQQPEQANVGKNTNMKSNKKW